MHTPLQNQSRTFHNDRVCAPVPVLVIVSILLVWPVVDSVPGWNLSELLVGRCFSVGLIQSALYLPDSVPVYIHNYT